VIPKTPHECCPTCERLILPERIAKNIRVSETIRSGVETPCWEWQGAVQKNGYGAVGWGGRRGRMESFHRIMYVLNIGPIPAGKLIRHRCDNRICGRPDHLIPGTHLENSRDMVERGRSRIGSRNGRAVLADSQVQEIRRLYADGKGSQREIASIFRIDQGRVSRIVRGLIW
jgi:hypothetical protein